MNRFIRRFSQVSLENLQGDYSGSFVIILGISVIRLNRPEVKNAIGRVFLNELEGCLAQVRESKARVVLVTSLVDKAFCAGADLKERAAMNPNQVAAFVYKLRSTFTELSNLPIPTISVINGVALGGGLELALSTDFRFSGPNAKLGLPETKLAIIPGAGGTQRLSRLVGTSKAKELVFTGRILNSESAVQIGLVNGASENPLKSAQEFAAEMLSSGPIAIQMAKLAIDKGCELSLASGLAFEQACYGNVIPTKDRLEGLLAFKEKRKPEYKGE